MFPLSPNKVAAVTWRRTCVSIITCDGIGEKNEKYIIGILVKKYISTLKISKKKNRNYFQGFPQGVFFVLFYFLAFFCFPKKYKASNSVGFLF